MLAIGRGLDRSGAASCAATSDDRLFAGMIVASAIGLFVIPMLYFTFQKPPRGQRRASPAFEQREESGVLTLIDLLRSQRDNLRMLRPRGHIQIPPVRSVQARRRFTTTEMDCWLTEHSCGADWPGT